MKLLEEEEQKKMEQMDPYQKAFGQKKPGKELEGGDNLNGETE